MVKGIARQVIIVKNSGSEMFDQAIFLVRDDLVAKGGITEESLLKEARQVCKSQPEATIVRNLIFSALGAAVVGLIWVLTQLI